MAARDDLGIRMKTFYEQIPKTKLMRRQANFSHKELQNKSCNDIQDMLMMQKGINWNDLPAYQKRGSCVIKSNDGETINEDNIGLDDSVIGTKITVCSKPWGMKQMEQKRYMEIERIRDDYEDGLCDFRRMAYPEYDCI